MLNFGSDNFRLGILAFVLMSIAVLIILRATRQSRVVRQSIKVPLIFIFLLLALYDILFTLGMSIPKTLERYYYALLYLSIAILFIRLAILLFYGSLLPTFKKYRAPKLLEEITGVVLFAIAAILIIQNTLNIQVTTVLATSAIITVVIGLALQETLGNLFAGLALQLDPAYQVGDWIQTGDNMGLVEEVTWRATKLRTLNNDFIIIPNGQIAKEKVTNHSDPYGPHATRVNVNVSYNVPPNKVSSVVVEMLKEVPNVTMEPSPDIRLNGFHDFSIEYQIKFFIREYAQLEPTLSAVRKALWYYFRRNEVEIPFPVRDVFLHDSKQQETKRDTILQHLTDSLRRVYLFSSLEKEELRLIAVHLSEVNFASGEFIIREGESGDSFFIMEEGEVEVFITPIPNQKKVLNTLRKGDFFGEIALLTGEKRTANVRAVDEVRVYQLSKENFKDVLESRPEILDEISNVLSRRKDEQAVLMAQSVGMETDSRDMNTQEAKFRILKRIRNYFGLRG
jgi:small-conductance mechanosensitive channel/CRP-like cAMP-binding protein